MPQLSALFPWNLGGDLADLTAKGPTGNTPRLAEFLKGRPKLELVLDGLGQRFASLGNVGTQLDTMRRLENAAGAQLDVLGGIVGQAREGTSDATFYRLIRARILANRSSGTIEQVYAVLALVLPIGAAFHMTDSFPAGFNLYVDSTSLTTADAYRVAGFLAASRGAGVRGLLFWRSATVPNTFTLDTALPAQSLDAGSFANAALYPGA